jgi:hypothetical protein
VNTRVERGLGFVIVRRMPPGRPSRPSNSTFSAACLALCEWPVLEGHGFSSRAIDVLMG